jgi:hemin uptake protein HemP
MPGTDGLLRTSHLPTTIRLTSAALMQGRREVEIEHGGRIYRLRLTASGKLILTG